MKKLKKQVVIGTTAGLAGLFLTACGAYGPPTYVPSDTTEGGATMSISTSEGSFNNSNVQNSSAEASPDLAGSSNNSVSDADATTDNASASSASSVSEQDSSSESVSFTKIEGTSDQDAKKAISSSSLRVEFYSKDYASLFRNNKELVKSLSPSNSIVASWSWYSHQRLANLPLVRIGEDAHRNPLMQNEKRKNLTILIVGETSRAENFSLNGYPRETNPRLAKDNVVYFPNTASCGTATAVSVPCMFSDMPREHYKEELAQHQEGVLDIIQRAGINVLWNDNDGGCKGACDRVPHQNVTALNLPGQCINGECYDEVLFHGLEEYINNLQGDGVIVLHTIGSHGPTYYNRYPPQFRKFTPTCDTNEIQTCSKEQLVNTYDNTLVYVDYIVDKAINLLKEHQDKFTTSLVYLSDHGESLGENGIYLHGLPYAIAPDSQKQVPMLLWLSEDYQKRYQVDQNCLQKQAQTQHYSQDNLFSTLLGLTGVETKYYQAADDILQTCRRVSE